VDVTLLNCSLGVDRDENEEFLWKAYFSATGVEEEVLATYNPIFPNSDGKFHDNGISGLTSLIKKMTVVASADPTTICAGDAVQLNAMVNGGCGTNTFAWSSNPIGFTSSLQNPIAMPDQTTTYTVSVTNTYGDSGVSSVDVTVNPLPVITGPDSAQVCLDQAPVTLAPSFQPSGGTFSGTGVTGSYFYPSIAGVGFHTITYTFTDPTTGCTNTLDWVFEVFPEADITCPEFMSACEGDEPVLLNNAFFDQTRLS